MISKQIFNILDPQNEESSEFKGCYEDPINEARIGLSTILEGNEELKKQNESLEKKMKANIKKYNDDLLQEKSENIKLRQGWRKITAQNYQYQNTIKQLETKIDTLTKQKLEVISQNNILLAQMKQMKDSEQSKRAIYKLKENKIINLQKTIEKHYQQLVSKNREIESILAEQQQKIAQLRAQNKTKVREYEDQIQQLVREYEIMKNARNQITKLHDSKKAEVEILRNDNNILKKQLLTLNNFQIQIEQLQNIERQNIDEKAELNRKILIYIQNQNNYVRKEQQYIQERSILMRRQKEYIQERRREEENSLCVICLDKKASHGLYPCGHMTYCEVCVADIHVCSLCNVEVQHKLQFFGKI